MHLTSTLKWWASSQALWRPMKNSKHPFVLWGWGGVGGDSLKSTSHDTSQISPPIHNFRLLEIWAPRSPLKGKKNCGGDKNTTLLLFLLQRPTGCQLWGGQPPLRASVSCDHSWVQIPTFSVLAVWLWVGLVTSLSPGLLSFIVWGFEEGIHLKRSGLLGNKRWVNFYLFIFMTNKIESSSFSTFL